MRLNLSGRGAPSMSRGLSTDTAFNSLPIELNKEIAHYLETDKDIVSFIKTCRAAHDAVNGDKFSFWRLRFREKFDMKDDKADNRVLKSKYQSRMKYLKRGILCSFSQLGHRGRENRIMEILRDIIVESHESGVTYGDDDRARSLNQVHLINFVLGSRSFLGLKPRAPRSLEPTGLMLAVQVMCAQLLFELDRVHNDLFAFDDSQIVVYASARRAPIFTDVGVINLKWLLHCMNFFLHHMKREDANSLYETMLDFCAEDSPSAWQAPLHRDPYNLSKYWKGTYAYLETNELKLIRSLHEGGQVKRNGPLIFEDKNIEMGGKIQELELNMTETDPRKWPKSFESRLQSLNYGPHASVRAQHSRATAHTQTSAKSIRLRGKGIDQNDRFFASGWLNPLPSQHGIPGWQRITIMKHFSEDYAASQLDDLWAYEGVVLPGGRLMFGRWWYASEEPDTEGYGNYSGPFILWASENPTPTDLDSDSE